jgi:hypothetical protein
MIKLTQGLRDIFGTDGEPKAQQYHPPVFLTGCMRSGTTFIADKLPTHPQLLKIGVEMNDIWTDIGGAAISGTCEYRNASHATPEYTFQMTSYIQDFINESKSLKRVAMRSYLKFFHGLGRAEYDWKNLKPLNKSPHLMNKLSYVGGLFPSSTLILIVREIHSHSASMKYHFEKLHTSDGRSYFLDETPNSCYGRTYQNQNRVRLFPGDFSIIPEMWMRMNELAFRELDNATFVKKIVISYEDLVRNQKGILLSLFRALDLEEKYHAEAMKIAGQGTILVNTTTKGNPLTKWHDQLSNDEKSAIDRLLTDRNTSYQFIMESIQKYKISPVTE